MQQAGQRDNLKGSWVYWDLMARASALMHYRRRVCSGVPGRGALKSGVLGALLGRVDLFLLWMLLYHYVSLALRSL